MSVNNGMATTITVAAFQTVCAACGDDPVTDIVKAVEFLRTL